MNKKTLIVFTYALAGLGHLRVVHAFKDGLRKDLPSISIGSSDKTESSVHHFMSVSPITRFIMELFQKGTAEDLFTDIYIDFLHRRSGHLLNDIVKAINDSQSDPEQIVFVCAHFGIAHKLTILRKEIEAALKCKIFIIVQVTDDSPQHIWYVPNVDLIAAPSEFTKKELEKYAKGKNLGYSPIEVIPYPVSPLFYEKLSDERYSNRMAQLDKYSHASINLCIPVSGAAVGMTFFLHLVNLLSKKSAEFNFHIVSRSAPFTRIFLDQISKFRNVKTHVSGADDNVVDLYEDLYKNEVVSLEITKPSEQAFKALLPSDAIGGSILLFCHPVGRQEYDNINFLRRHKIIFTKEEQQKLWEKSDKSESISEAEFLDLFCEKRNLRGVELPIGSERAANFIWWCLRQGIFEKILEQGLMPENRELETRGDGVKLFWDRIYKLAGINETLF